MIPRRIALWSDKTEGMGSLRFRVELVISSDSRERITPCIYDYSRPLCFCSTCDFGSSLINLVARLSAGIKDLTARREKKIIKTLIDDKIILFEIEIETPVYSFIIVKICLDIT